MNIELQVDGFEEAIRNIHALPGLMAHRVMGDGLSAAARVVRNEARVLVPVATGALQQSIRTRRRAVRIDTLRGRVRVPGAGAQTLAGGPGARHAFLVEHGGEVNRSPHPYLLPALLSTKGQQVNAAGKAMQRAWARIQSGRISQPLARLAAR